MQSPVRRVEVLGVRLACLTYPSGLEEVRRLAWTGRPAAVCAANTHIVSLARHDPSFARVIGAFDLLLPDGMPLIWALNRRGAGLHDRVYGPYFMRYVLLNSPRPWRHFFFGGKPETQERLIAAMRNLQPDLEVAGRLSPPFREWTEADEAGFARQIRESGADFIWVALGGERQERWIARNLHRHGRGVFLAVGDAFELLAGNRPFAPFWMQRHGLTWLYRLFQEPRRLWPRYLRYNSLFVRYFLRDRLVEKWRGWRGRGARAGEGAVARDGKWRIAFVGSRGVPARYSGFETVVEELGARLAARGHAVTVYNRMPYYEEIRGVWRGMRLRWFPTIPTKSLDTIVHTTLCTIDACFRKYDVLYICGVGNTPRVSLVRRLTGARTVINVDGADFKRKKWGPVARWWLQASEKRATRVADAIIADNRTVVAHYEKDYGYRPIHLSYGAEIRTRPVRRGELERWGLQEGGYILHVSRLTPENETDFLIRAHARRPGLPPLVVVGSSGYETAYAAELRALAGPGVVFTGARYGDAYVELSQHARFFVMPATIEATRLVLLDQMGMGRAVLYRDCIATREVLGDAGQAFGGGGGVEAEIGELAGWMERLAGDAAHCAELGRRALERVQREYSWDAVTDRYETLFGQVLGRTE